MRGYTGTLTPVAIRSHWQTPRALYDSLNREFSFVGDVAASDANHLHSNYLTEQQDALSVDWAAHFGSGYKWCNPPYDDVGPWIDKAANHRGVVMLIPADLSTGWGRKAYDTADEIRLINGRLSFIRADTQEPQGGNNKGSMIVIYHPTKHRGSDTCKMSLVNRDDLLRVIH
ncbi:phage N-6-adenine-methyltransferase [Salmonella enterica]|nr:phage N-6-adenine-methyltransferase [Salmonella enterica]